MAKIGIRDVAAACGVTVSTVSKALNHSERISAATVARIEQMARQMGYVPSDAAGRLASKERRIALFLPASAKDPKDRLQSGVRRALPFLTARGISAEIFYCEPGFTPPEEAVAARYDGVIAPASLIGRIGAAATRPLVLFQSRSTAVEPIAQILPDYRIAGRLAAQFLAYATAGGQTAALSARRGTYVQEELLRGYRELSAKLAIPVAGIVEGNNDPRVVATEMRRLLSGNARLRGLFVTSPLLSTVTAAQTEAKRKLTVVAADFGQTAIEALRSGNVSALLYLAPERQVAEAMVAMRDYLCGGVRRGTVLLRPELVLKSNLECYLDK